MLCISRTLSRVLTLPYGEYGRKKARTFVQALLSKMAVREGFEPSIRCRIHTFQACSFSLSDTSPNFSLPPEAATGRYYMESWLNGQAEFLLYVLFAQRANNWRPGGVVSRRFMDVKKPVFSYRLSYQIWR